MIAELDIEINNLRFQVLNLLMNKKKINFNESELKSMIESKTNEEIFKHYQNATKKKISIFKVISIMIICLSVLTALYIFMPSKLFADSSNTQELSLRKYKDKFCYDGDTCYVNFNGEKKKIRLLELDTPEISKPKCKAELELGLKARDYLNDLINNSNSIEFKTDYELDYFGRILAYLIIDGENVSAKIVENNLGVVYKKNNKKDWCS